MKLYTLKQATVFLLCVLAVNAFFWIDEPLPKVVFTAYGTLLLGYFYIKEPPKTEEVKKMHFCFIVLCFFMTILFLGLM